MTFMTSQEIADLVEGHCHGPVDLTIHGVASLDRAEPGTVSFLGNRVYEAFLLGSLASVVLVPVDHVMAPPTGRAWIGVENPRVSFSKLIDAFLPSSSPPASGIHPSVVFAESAQIDSTASIGPNVVVEADAVIGPGCRIDGGCYVGDSVTMGADCRLHPNVTLCEKTVLGNRVCIQSGTVIGSDGFGFHIGSDGATKIPQVGYVQIDDDVDIGSNVSIDRARFERTWIQRGVKIDNLVQIAHNVIIGEHSVIVAQVGIAGSTELGRGVIVAGQAAIAEHVKIGDGAIIRPMTGVITDVDPGADVMGQPALPRLKFLRQQAVASKLPELRRQLKELQKAMAKLEQND